MFYVLSKTVYIFLMPLFWVFVLMVYALFSRRGRKKNIALFLAISLLYIFSNQVVSNELLLRWERPATPLASLKGPYQVGIVLSGVTNNFKSPADRVYLNKGADRIMHAVLLYKRGYLQHILITGSYHKLSGEVRSEASLMREVMLLAGVPDSVITIEDAARNTHENAVNSAQILNEKFPGGKYLLITSAFHLRRAEACFAKAGISTDPFSVDFYTTDPDYNLFTLLVPSERALSNTYTLFHEVLGYVVYKLQGYA